MHQESNKNKIFRDYINRNWYIQSCSAVPIFLSTAAISGFTMKQELGYAYDHFLFNCYNNYGEMAYDPEDQKRIYRIIVSKINQNPNYLVWVKNLYLKKLRPSKDLWHQSQPSNLRGLNNQELLLLFKKLMNNQVASVGVAHILDAISIEIEKDLHNKLSQELSANDRQKFNQIFSYIITPNKISYLRQEEEELSMIMVNSDEAKYLSKHARKYFWINSGYAGLRMTSISDFKKRLLVLRKESLITQPSKIQPKFRLSQTLRDMKKMINYCTVWQDERKALATQNIAYTSLALKEIARRCKLKDIDFYYLLFDEIQDCLSLIDLSKKAQATRDRINGCLIISRSGGDTVLSGSSYSRLFNNKNSLFRHSVSDNLQISGITANPGQALGHIKIIKYIKDLKNFPVGSILVTSMTRPDYMTAIRQAAAIITDEGGVTCHAAIIARELKIPCIISTKNATRQLKNNDLVEVDACNGIIKIIK